MMVELSETVFMWTSSVSLLLVAIGVVVFLFKD